MGAGHGLEPLRSGKIRHLVHDGLDRPLNLWQAMGIHLRGRARMGRQLGSQHISGVEQFTDFFLISYPKEK